MKNNEYSVLEYKVEGKRNLYHTDFGVSLFWDPKNGLMIGDFNNSRKPDIEELKSLSDKFDQLETLIEILSSETDSSHINAMKKIKRLKKQIPRKVTYEDIGYNPFHDENVFACICPSCGLHIITFTDSDVESSKSDVPEQMFHDCLTHHNYEGLNNFCNRCGQKLDWSK